MAPSVVSVLSVVRGGQSLRAGLSTVHCTEKDTPREGVIMSVLTVTCPSCEKVVDKASLSECVDCGEKSCGGCYGFCRCDLDGTHDEHNAELYYDDENIPEEQRPILKERWLAALREYISRRDPAAIELENLVGLGDK